MITKRHIIGYGSLILIIMLLLWFGHSVRKQAHENSIERSVYKSTLEATEKKLINEKDKTAALETIVSIEKNARVKTEKEVDRLKARRMVINRIVMHTKKDSLQFFIHTILNCDSVVRSQDTVISHFQKEVTAMEDIIISSASQVAILEGQVYDLSQIEKIDQKQVASLNKKLNREIRRKRFWRGVGVGAGIALAVAVMII